MLARSAQEVAWGIRQGISDVLARELTALARDEPPAADPRQLPEHVERYRALGSVEWFGPAFELPVAIAAPVMPIVEIDDERVLAAHFRGWVAGEIAASAAPVMAVVADGHPVSICFCARRSERAAEAGVDTAAAYRGRGYAGQVTAAWARAVRATGRTPLYSTSWINHSSLAVARKLGLVAYASTWSIE